MAIDTETTGLDPHHDVLVALAAIPFRDGEPHVEDGYTRLVNPGRPIPHAATAIHGIADGDVRDAPPPALALPPFLALCAERPVVAHTAAFDLAIVKRAASAAGLGVVFADPQTVRHRITTRAPYNDDFCIPPGRGRSRRRIHLPFSARRIAVVALSPPAPAG